MTQYLLSVYDNPDNPNPTDEEIQAAYKAVDVFNHKLQAEGVWIFAGGLHPVETASVVRAMDGQTVTTDGPFIESKEHLGGFWVLELPDLDAALAHAAEGSAACRNPVEVRPFQEVPE
jgi:hypothetical protein